MKVKTEFFVGWTGDAPRRTVRTSVLFVILGCVLAAGVVISLVLGQKELIGSRFDYGNETTLTGKIYLDPIPMLQLDAGKDGARISLPLIGFGKQGPEPALQEAMQDLTEPIESYRATVRGTLIFYDSKTLLELTAGASSFVSFEEDADQTNRSRERIGMKAVYGEIMDAKCFFGVMNPGHGKTHKACGIRCISGGVPAVLATWDENGDFYDYYILKASSVEETNSRILPFVGLPVIVRGEVEQVEDWLTISLAEVYPYLAHSMPNRPLRTTSLCLAGP